jgi:glutathionylspermidine synthase
VHVNKDTSAKPRNFAEFLETLQASRKIQGYNDVIHLFRMCLHFADGIIVNADALWKRSSIIIVTHDSQSMSFILRNGIVIRFELGADGKAHPVVGMLPQLAREVEEECRF